MAELRQSLHRLPLLPAVIVQLMRLDSEADDYLEEVKELVSGDPALAARLLRLANSPASAPVAPITSVSMAVTRLGAKQVAQMATSLGVVRVFVPSTENQRNLWRHAIQVAVISRAIAKHNPQLILSPDECYLAGLLHDIGRFVMFEGDPDTLDAIDELKWATPEALTEAERKVCGYDHATLGWLACKKWGIPKRLTNLVRNHHVSDPLDATRVNSNLLATVQVADHLSVGLLTERIDPEAEKGTIIRAIQRICLPERWDVYPIQANALCELLPTMIEDSERLLDAIGID